MAFVFEVLMFSVSFSSYSFLTLKKSMRQLATFVLICFETADFIDVTESEIAPFDLIWISELSGNAFLVFMTPHCGSEELSRRIVGLAGKSTSTSASAKSISEMIRTDEVGLDFTNSTCLRIFFDTAGSSLIAPSSRSMLNCRWRYDLALAKRASRIFKASCRSFFLDLRCFFGFTARVPPISAGG